MRFSNWLAGWLAMALAAAVSLPTPALADDGKPAEQLLACAPARGDVVAVNIERVRYGLNAGGVWAKARLEVVMRNGASRHYSIDGRAQPITSQLTANRTAARFAYPEFACVVNYGAIFAVRNCRSHGNERTCDVGVTMFGLPVAFAVSMLAARETIADVTMP
jgi:hypothetical protein